MPISPLIGSHGVIPDVVQEIPSSISKIPSLSSSKSLTSSIPSPSVSVKLAESGHGGAEIITTSELTGDIHPTALVSVNV